METGLREWRAAGAGEGAGVRWPMGRGPRAPATHVARGSEATRRRLDVSVHGGNAPHADSLDRAWAKCLEHAGITKRFTVHGLRYTFTDLVRRANVDAVVRRALTGHVTEQMQRHYSTVGLDEKRAAIAGVLRLCRLRAAERRAVKVSPEVAPRFGATSKVN